MRGRTEIRSLVAVLTVVAALCTGGAQVDSSDDHVNTSDLIIFPVAGDNWYTDTWGAPRSGGRTHKGTDIFADKLTPVVAVADGTVVRISIGKLAGRYIVVEHESGWRSLYLHLNNDTPGTDDGLGGESVPGIEVGAAVEAGELLDYVGDSGNAEGTPPHLHFEWHQPDNTAVNPYSYLRAAQGVAPPPAPIVAASPATSVAEYQTSVAEYQEINTEVIGRFDPGGGFVADVVVHNDAAYVGTWGRAGLCPNTGMRIIDVADPEHPELLGSLAGRDDFPGTAAETVWVGEIETSFFEGDLAVVTLRLCDNTESGRHTSQFRGLALYDVTELATPTLLSTWHSGDLTQGSNAVSVQQRSDGMVLLATTVRQSLLHTDGVLGDVRILDATDPAKPIELSDWDNRRDGTQDPIDGYEEESHAHGVELSLDGRSAWVSHWDAGSIMLDLGDPAVPAIVGDVACADSGDFNRHTSIYDENRSLLNANSEDFYPTASDDHQDGWGIQRIYDVSIPTSPVQIGQFSTEHSTERTMGLGGIYTAHDTVLDGDLAVSSWYSDGIRIVDLSEPDSPMEVGSFVPAPRQDPTRYWLAPDGSSSFSMVWGVDVYGGLIYLSDMHSGLWIINFDRNISAAGGISRLSPG